MKQDVSPTKIDDEKLWIPDNYPVELAGMARSIAAFIRKNLPTLAPELVPELALGAVEYVRVNHGGSAMYLGKGYSYERSLRDKEIWREFTGNNHEEMARKHDVVPMRIYQILAQMKAHDMAMRQRGLF